MLNRLLPALLCCLLAVTAARSQDLTRRAKPQEAPIAITGATVHPVSGPAIENGYVLFDNGIITEVGPLNGDHPFAPSVKRIDAKGKHIYPGFIGAHTQLGLTEIGSVRASRDFNEVGELTPEVFAAVSVNPDSNLLTVARSNGVLAAGVFPSGGLIPGRPSVIVMEGWTWENMTVKRDAGLIVSWPFMRSVRAPWMDRSEDEQLRDVRQNLERIREAFRLARAYIAAKAADPATPTDLRWEAMRAVLARDNPLPIFAEATEYDQITSAISFAREFNLKLVIVGGRDAPLCAELLKKQDVPVIVQGTFSMPRRDDSPYDEPYSLPARLAQAGVRFALASGQETPHERNLPYCAAMAVAHGLSKEQALRSITLSAAEILGVADRLGSLDKGKSATLIVTDGEAMEVSTTVETAFINGMQIDLRNKQSELAEKYREKYKAPAAPAK